MARLSARTVNKQLTAITTLLSWSRKNGYVENNVAAGLTVPVAKNTDDGRQPYSVDGVTQAGLAAVVQGRKMQATVGLRARRDGQIGVPESGIVSAARRIFLSS